MKKLTKSNLEELAKVMPVLSEEEQKGYVGGDTYNMDSSGHLTWQSFSIDTVIKAEPMIPYETGAVFSSNKTIDMVESEDGMRMQGSGVDLDLFKFMADNTNVEWALSVKTYGKYGSLNTNYNTDNVTPILEEGCDTIYHNHQSGSLESSADKTYIDDLRKKGYEASVIYNEPDGSLNYYWDKNNE